MIRKISISLFWFGMTVAPLWSQTTGSLGLSTGVSLNGPQWKKVVSEFEDSVFSLAKRLETLQTEKKTLQDEISQLEQKTALLRQNTQKETGVFDEIRLKSLLNELKEKLEKNAALQHEWDDRQMDFEQKALSLIALYNDRIDSDLGTAILSSDPTQLRAELDELTLLVQKRNRIQSLLKEYQKKVESNKPLPVTSFGNLYPSDPDSLLLTLDLLRDRKKELEEKLEKWSIEEEEIRNEMKLQEKMQEFLGDIERMNEDSNFPHDSLKRNDLGEMAGNKERKQLEAHLTDVQKRISRGQSTLNQLNQLINKIQNQVGPRGGGGSQ